MDWRGVLVVAWVVAVGCWEGRGANLPKENEFALYNLAEEVLGLGQQRLAMPNCALVEQAPGLAHFLPERGPPMTLWIESGSLEPVDFSQDCVARRYTLPSGESAVVFDLKGDERVFDHDVTPQQLPEKVLALDPTSIDAVRSTTPEMLIPRAPELGTCADRPQRRETTGLVFGRIVEIRSEGACHDVIVQSSPVVEQRLCTGPDVPFAVGDWVELAYGPSHVRIAGDGRLWVESREPSFRAGDFSISVAPLAGGETCLTEGVCPLIGFDRVEVSVADETFEVPTREAIDVKGGTLWVHGFAAPLLADPECEPDGVYGWTVP